MHFKKKYSFSRLYFILFPILLITSILTMFINHPPREKLLIKIQQRLSFHFDQLTSSSKSYLRVRLDLISNIASCQITDHLIIYILSKVTNTQRRKAIRSTWASPLSGTCFVFIVGQTRNSSVTPSDINHEKVQYRDIIQIDHLESYANVVYKEIAALQWSYYFYPSIPYLFKTDDDLILDSILISSVGQLLVTNLSNSTPYISKHNSIFISNILSADRPSFFRGGLVMADQPTVRDQGKFGISESVWPHSFLPSYCSGFGWFMSNYTRTRLFETSYTYSLNKTVWIGDVFLSGFLAKEANVKCTSMLIEYDQTFSANCPCLLIRNPMLTVCSSKIHGEERNNETEKYSEHEKAWRVIQQRHNLTQRTSTETEHCS